MGESYLTFAEAYKNYEPLAILKITTPKGVYSSKEETEIYTSIQKQVGKYYLPIIVPEDVRLEIITEF